MILASLILFFFAGNITKTFHWLEAIWDKNKWRIIRIIHLRFVLI